MKKGTPLSWATRENKRTKSGLTRVMQRLMRKRAWAIQIQNRTRAAKLTAMNEYRQARKRKKHLLRKKKGQLDDQAVIEIERHHSVQDSLKFYDCLNDTRKPQ
jgi:hypothetical protein